MGSRRVIPFEPAIACSVSRRVGMRSTSRRRRFADTSTAKCPLGEPSKSAELARKRERRLLPPLPPAFGSEAEPQAQARRGEGWGEGKPELALVAERTSSAVRPHPDPLPGGEGEKPPAGSRFPPALDPGCRAEQDTRHGQNTRARSFDSGGQFGGMSPFSEATSPIDRQAGTANHMEEDRAVRQVLLRGRQLRRLQPRRAHGRGRRAVLV